MSIYTELALYGNKKEFARTGNVYLPISEFCDGSVSLDESMDKLRCLVAAGDLLPCVAVLCGLPI